MPARNTAKSIRLGMLALPLTGLLLIAAVLALSSAPYLAADTDPGRTALSLVSMGYAVGMSLYIAGVTLALLGVIALVAYLSDSRGGRWAMAAMVPTIVGFALILSFLDATA